MSDFCQVCAASAAVEFHDFLSNGVAHAVLFEIGVGALLACYQVQVSGSKRARPRLVFLALLAISLLLGAGLTYVGTRVVSTTEDYSDWDSHEQYERFGLPAYAVAVPFDNGVGLGNAVPQPVNRVALVVDTVFWAGLVCVILTLLPRERLGGSEGYVRPRHRSR